MNNGHLRLKLLSYLHAARPNGQDVQTLADGLRYDGFPNQSKDNVEHELRLMEADGFAVSALDKLSKSRLLWRITDAGIETALQFGVVG